MIETSRRTHLKPATNQTLRPGDFPLGSQKSRAAARAVLQERSQPIPPPWGTLNLSFLTVERARELYAKLSALPEGQMLGTAWFPIRWPDGFKPGDARCLQLSRIPSYAIVRKGIVTALNRLRLR